MFDDFDKKKPKKGGVPNRSDVIAKAEGERKRREEERRFKTGGEVIKRTCRRWRARLVNYKSICASFDGKVADVIRLKQILALNNVPFVCPPPVLCELMVTFNYIARHHSFLRDGEGMRLVKKHQSKKPPQEGLGLLGSHYDQIRSRLYALSALVKESVDSDPSAVVKHMKLIDSRKHYSTGGGFGTYIFQRFYVSNLVYVYDPLCVDGGPSASLQLLQLLFNTNSTDPQVVSYSNSISYWLKKGSYTSNCLWSLLRKSLISYFPDPLSGGVYTGHQKESTSALCDFVSSAVTLHARISPAERDEALTSCLFHILSIPILSKRVPLKVLASMWPETLWLQVLALINDKFTFIQGQVNYFHGDEATLWLFGNVVDISNQMLPHLKSNRDSLNVLLSTLCLFLSTTEASVFDYDSPHRWRVRGKNNISVAIPSYLRDQIYIIASESFIRGVAREVLSVDRALLKPRKFVSDGSKLSLESIQTKSSTVLWKTSQWAMKIASNLFSRRPSGSAGDTKLVNVSAQSKSAAEGEGFGYSAGKGTGMDDGTSKVASSKGKGGAFDVAGVTSFCRMCSLYLSKRKSLTFDKSAQLLLNTIAFSTQSAKVLWDFLEDNADFNRLDFSDIVEAECSGIYAVLGLWAACYSHMLLVVDDFELYEQQFPLELSDIERVVRQMKLLLYPVYTPNTLDPKRETAFGKWLISVLTKMLKDVYDRSSRRPLCPEEAWLVPGVRSCASILNEMPYTIPFMERLKIFEAEAVLERRKFQGDDGREPGIRVRIRRDQVFDDGLRSLYKPSLNLKQRISVTFITPDGRDESGIDIGGVFKEFWTTLSNVAFDPSYGLFVTNSDNLMYPNPNAKTIVGDDYLTMYNFLGRILGKALFEGITVQPQLAHFFLRKLLGKSNGLNELPSLDVELYRNLMFLKTYEGDARDLSLDFTITTDEFGFQREIELLPGGKSIEVTNENKIRYIHYVAHFKLNVEFKKPLDAFCAGFHEIIPANVLSVFSESEFQTLISGSGGDINLDDLKANSRYAGGFHSFDSTVRMFWNVAYKFSQEEKQSLLRFTTSCERAPPLGFQQLDPKFCLHRIPISKDDERLPTASTCFNTLKLPTYSSERVMREKLLFAFKAGVGFELT